MADWLILMALSGGGILCLKIRESGTLYVYIYIFV